MEKTDFKKTLQGRFKNFLRHSAKDIVEVWPYFKRLGKYVKPYRFRWMAGLIIGAVAGAWEAALLPLLKKSFEYLEMSHVHLTGWE